MKGKVGKRIGDMIARMGARVSVVDNRKNPASALSMRERKAKSLEKVSPEAAKSYQSKARSLGRLVKN